MPEQNNPSTALAPVPPPDFSNIPVSTTNRAVFLPTNLADAMKLAEFMSGGIGVRQFMRGNPSACFAVLQMAMRWGMDPYIVANKSYYTNDTLAFESQLVNAVINTSGEIVGRLKVEFAGEATGGKGNETLVCKVTGRLHADPEQVFEHRQALRDVTIRNSPLWTVNPRQQLAYHATRAWARLFMPEVLLGVYTPDEITDGAAQQIVDASTPKDDTPAPDRRDFAAQDAEFDEIETVVQETPDEPAAQDPPVPPVSGDTADNSGGGDALAGASDSPQAEPVTETKPSDPLKIMPQDTREWAFWREAAAASIEPISTRAEFNAVRRRMVDVLDKAPEDLLGEIQDLLSDKLVTIPEETR